MEEQKIKRVRSAFIVGAVLLLVILLAVLTFQIVKISKEKKELQLLKDEIARYQLLTDEERDDLEAMDSRKWIEQRARELGLSLEGDYKLD